MLLALKRVAPYFSDGYQHDAHEVYSFLLQELEEELTPKQTTRSTIENLFISSRKDSEEMVSKRFDTWWKHYKHDNCTPITDLFYGYSITSCECPTCGCTTYSMSSFNTLHTTLTLTRIRVSYSLIFQQWNGEANELRFILVNSSVCCNPQLRFNSSEGRLIRCMTEWDFVVCVFFTHMIRVKKYIDH